MRATNFGADASLPFAHAIPINADDVTPLPCQPSAPVAPVRDLRTATQINGGSSRIMLPETEATTTLSPDGIRHLRDQGYSHGLINALAKNKRAFPIRIWVVDSSGSMATRDGHRLLPNGRNNSGRNKHALKSVACTRWSELQQTVEYHAQMAALLKKPTIFRLLNDPGTIAGPQHFSVAERATHVDHDLALAIATLQNTMPGGVTPLTKHICEIRQSIVALEPSLRRDGTKVVLVLATDGIPTNDQGFSSDAITTEFVNSLRSLEGLPVWIVVRLCTDEDAVVEFWNSLDEHLELSLEVLDDFTAEAKEVAVHNPWLNYGLPLHRMREMGFYNRLFDILDERRLAKDELRDFFGLLFGYDRMDGVPDADADWNAFISSVSRLNDGESMQWNPLTGRMEPWVNVRQLKKVYAPSFFQLLFG
jgi:Mg-chelatase subunit ChlD